jgi:hypothetical protein
MIIFMEKIDPPPPLIPLSEGELAKLRLEARAREDRWVKNFIERLAGKAQE